MKTLITLFRKNAYFFLPFLLWLLAGGVIQSSLTREELFTAINHNCSDWADVVMTAFTYLGDGLFYAIVLLCFLLTQRYRQFFIGLASILLVAVLVQLIKHQVDAPRPLAYFPSKAMIHMVSWVPVHSYNSFPSGHSAAAFSLFCYLSLINKKSKMWGLLFAALAMIAAYSRIYLAQHFFIDVYAGSVIGVFSSFLVYSLFEFRNTTKMPEVCTPTAVAQLAEAKMG